jgi:hypothetical protein
VRLCLAAGLLAATMPAAAATTARFTVRFDPEIVWFEATVSDASAGELRIVILAPDEDGGRRPWQRCSFADNGTGPYRCGIDRAAASGFPGEWLAKAVLDGTVIGRKRVWIE